MSRRPRQNYKNSLFALVLGGLLAISNGAAPDTLRACPGGGAGAAAAGAAVLFRVLISAAAGGLL